MDKIFKFIINNAQLKAGDYIVIGLSGGPDSMVLLDHLLKLRERCAVKIVCAHVHHNVRKESDEEAKLIKGYCLMHDVIFEMTKLEAVQHFSEAFGHEKRYAFFEQIIRKYHAKYLFTAHHGDDLIETILMRIVRGSTPKGYTGFGAVTNGKKYTILRPLVFYNKEDILEYAKENKIPYFVDKTNDDINYTRNRFRKYVLPILKKENNHVEDKFIQYHELLSDYVDYVEKQALGLYPLIVDNNIININLLKKQHHVLIYRIIIEWLHEQYKGDIKNISYKHTGSIIKMLFNSKPNMRISLPRYNVIKSYNHLYLEKNMNYQDYEYILDESIKLPNDHEIVVVEKSLLTSNYVTYLNSLDLELPLYVRNYRKGDRMRVKNMVGHKKISEIFINEKVNFEIRNNYPVVVDGTGEIIWLPGIKKSVFDSQKAGKYDIILEYR